MKFRIYIGFLKVLIDFYIQIIWKGKNNFISRYFQENKIKFLLMVFFHYIGGKSLNELSSKKKSYQDFYPLNTNFSSYSSQRVFSLAEYNLLFGFKLIIAKDIGNYKIRKNRHRNLFMYLERKGDFAFNIPCVVEGYQTTMLEILKSSNGTYFNYEAVDLKIFFPEYKDGEYYLNGDKINMINIKKPTFDRYYDYYDESRKYDLLFSLEKIKCIIDSDGYINYIPHSINGPALFQYGMNGHKDDLPNGKQIRYNEDIFYIVNGVCINSQLKNLNKDLSFDSNGIFYNDKTDEMTYLIMKYS